MLVSKIKTVKPLIESSSGIHLTAYIKNRGDVSDLKNQIQDAIELGEQHLSPVMTVDEINQFLAPLRLFQKDAKRLKIFKENIALFRTEKSFRALSLPVEVETTCIVANTFHVKPILKWIQIDRDFLLLGLEPGSASLYQGDLKNLKFIDTVTYPESLKSRENATQEIMEWVNGWIMNLTNEIKPRLFVAGKAELTRPLLAMLQYENTSKKAILPFFSQLEAPKISSEVRSAMRAETKKIFERTLVEFHYAIDTDQAKGNIFAIARAAVQGKIRKLLIAEGIQIFGNLNRKSGELKINGRDLDHEDDDILDDIAQSVLAHGGEVTVARRDEIPKGRPILAIMDTHESELESVAGPVGLNSKTLLASTRQYQG